MEQQLIRFDVSLPTELLARIFGLCWQEFSHRCHREDDEDEHEDAVWYQMHRARLAHDPLLTLSRVCSRWHFVAIGTPSLWADILLTECLVSTERRTAATVLLLRSVLERAGSVPLNIAAPDVVPTLVSELLSSHSEQWRQFGGTLNCLHTFLDVEGSDFPRMEVLDVDIWQDHPSRSAIAQMRNVRLLRVCSQDTIHVKTAAAFPRFDFPRLAFLHFVQGFPPNQPSLIASLPQLSQDAELRLTLTMWEDEPLLHAPLTSNAQAFTVEFLDPHFIPLEYDIVDPLFEPLKCDIALKSLMSEITLSHLLHLNLESDNWPFLPLPWPHADFLALCARSSFHTQLRTLDISPVHITEEQLLECLLGLTVLEELVISDPPAAKICEPAAAPDPPLISDSLLKQLSLTAGSSPLVVPRLTSIIFYSQLRFDASVFLAFVVSRITPYHRFAVELTQLSESCRELDPAVRTRLGELQASERVWFGMGAPVVCEETHKRETSDVPL
ncbi:hypothetical protein C8R46DRAFT_672892 [Mycena filopes]|nr:hypothetical protein C8R46DRAFT_672892 [Mycena filopes]